MAINIKRTADVANINCNISVYGSAGAGKTTLIRTLEDPIILSAEGGLLSIKDSNLPYIEIENMESLGEAYQFLTSSEEAKQYKSVAIDSVSEIAEVCLLFEKGKTKDARQAYGAMGDQLAMLIRSFRDMPFHVYMTFKVAQEKDEQGRLLYAPTVPGSKAAQSLPYYPDFLFPLHAWKDEETGETMRMLQTQPDGLWQAKSRDEKGVLDAWETPDLSALIKKIQEA